MSNPTPPPGFSNGPYECPGQDIGRAIADGR